jgi:hypothetical protein
MHAGIGCSSLNGYDGVVNGLTANNHDRDGHSAAHSHQHQPTTRSAEPHSLSRSAVVQQLFVRAADLKLDFDPKQMKDDGSAADITP